jgi:predicted esterase
MTEAQGTYVARLPAGYDKTKPYPVIIGTHGCGDSADNFATWGPAAWNDGYNNGQGARENDIQSYIALSVEDQSGQCWQIADAGKVLAALDDAISCFYVDQGRVTMAGYSSGAAVAYEVGLANALRFAGILIEDGALYDNGSNEASLLANAAWKINIAHIAHESDPDYPLAQVQADWQVIDKAGFNVKEYVVPGDHSGTSVDWYGTLDPDISGWSAP